MQEEYCKTNRRYNTSQGNISSITDRRQDYLRQLFKFSGLRNALWRRKLTRRRKTEERRQQTTHTPLTIRQHLKPRALEDLLQNNDDTLPYSPYFFTILLLSCEVCQESRSIKYLCRLHYPLPAQLDLNRTSNILWRSTSLTICYRISCPKNQNDEIYSRAATGNRWQQHKTKPFPGLSLFLSCLFQARVLASNSYPRQVQLLCIDWTPHVYVIFSTPQQVNMPCRDAIYQMSFSLDLALRTGFHLHQNVFTWALQPLRLSLQRTVLVVQAVNNCSHRIVT